MEPGLSCIVTMKCQKSLFPRTPFFPSFTTKTKVMRKSDFGEAVWWSQDQEERDVYCICSSCASVQRGIFCLSCAGSPKMFVNNNLTESVPEHHTTSIGDVRAQIIKKKTFSSKWRTLPKRMFSWFLRNFWRFSLLIYHPNVPLYSLQNVNGWRRKIVAFCFAGGCSLMQAAASSMSRDEKSVKKKRHLFLRLLSTTVLHSSSFNFIPVFKDNPEPSRRSSVCGKTNITISPKLIWWAVI